MRIVIIDIRNLENNPLARRTPLSQILAGSRTHCIALRLKEVLSQKERDKMSAFHYTGDSLLYGAAHAMLRRELSRDHPGVSPSDWVFRTSSNGKPYIEAADKKIMFNLSHSWPYAAVLLGGQGEGGVDIEYAADQLAFNDLASMVLTEDKQTVMRQSRNPQITFLQFWTMKEAVSKALGYGLALDFSRLSIGDGLEVFLEQHKLPLRPWSVVGPNQQYVLAACVLEDENLRPVVDHAALDNLFESVISGETE